LDAPLVCSNFCRLIRPNRRSHSKFLYLWLRQLYSKDELLQFETGTTGIKNLAFTRFSAGYGLCVPRDDLLAQFENEVGPLFARRHAGAGETECLVCVRDTLLPKLISGEVPVKAVDGLRDPSAP
jgi:type I restriction enzyme S subunit